jgi:threonine dehydratase
MKTPPKLNDILTAHERIESYIHQTPVMTCAALDQMTGASLFFKCENFQKGGAFKARGAFNAVLSLSNEEASSGVITHSSGNHAAALAIAAQVRKIPAYIVMPSTAPAVKKAAVEGYGGKITFCEPTLTARIETTQLLIAETNAILIHPYDDYRIIAGAATAALELLEDIPGLDYIFAPVGGGGLVSGTALIAHYMNPHIKIVGCEPENADDAYRSFKEDRLVTIENPKTIADGLRTMLSDKTFGIIKKYVDDIITVTEEEIITAMRTVWERMKIIIEPSSAVAVAPILYGKLSAPGKRIGIILSGGNVDLENLPF